MVVLTTLVVWSGASAEEWKPVSGTLMTPWAKDVTQDNVLPDYPRPQLVRPQWVNLNGLWDYAVTADAAEPQDHAGKILVPFPIESALSGVGRRLEPYQVLRYRRAFPRPDLQPGERLLLHFGAIDWHAVITLNERPVGEHRGGYDPFTCDVTAALTAAGAQELVVSVRDPTDSSDQACGKQSLVPSNSCYYSPVSGIWQTVWLERVPEAYITAVQADTAPALDAVLVTIATQGARPDARWTVRSRDGATLVSEAEGSVASPMRLPVAKPRLWTPQDPHLYGLEVSLTTGDRVSSYCALRTIAVMRDEHGHQRLALNDIPGFQFGMLDQGYWPDGLYTAPTDEALRADIQAMKNMGFNMVRKHIKVESARWYHWCDRLGLMVWQDLPSAKGLRGSASGRAQFAQEGKAIFAALRPFPCIVMWVLFNEGWGQGGYGLPESKALGEWLREHDRSRLVNTASGWTDVGGDHVRDMHFYPIPDMPPTDGIRASVVGEFGGLPLYVPGHTWRPSKTTAKPFTNTAFKDRYQALMPALRVAQGQGLAAAVYTQLTDVENELNALLSYDRVVNKCGEEWLSAQHRPLYAPPAPVTTLAGGSVPWSFTTVAPPGEWTTAAFSDVAWDKSRSPFGANHRGAQTLTPWWTPAMWLRQTFSVPAQAEACQIILRLVRGAKVVVFLNGMPLPVGAVDGIENFPLIGHPALRPGDNVIAAEVIREEGQSRASFDLRVIAY